MAVELVCGALLSSTFQVAFERLASPEVLDYFRGRKLNQTLLKRLNIKLLSINAVLDDAERKQIRNRHVKAWLDMVKDAVFEAEDLLDEIDTHVSQCKQEAEFQSSTSKVWNIFDPTPDQEIDESRIEEILDNLEYLAKEKDILGLKEAIVGSGSQVSQKLPSTCLLSETVIYGRDVDKEIIFNWLVPHTENDDNQLSVISIVGMGGLGKTTLAQHLYNDPRILKEGKFDIRAWVCVSDEFDVFKVTRAILEAITGSTDDTRDLNMLQLKLKEVLSQKKFLLVLDNVWNEKRDQWEALQTPLNYGAKGSKILVTARSLKVASTMRSTQTHQLEQLQEEHCRKLFAKHAFQNENSQINHEFKEIGMKIITKCKGLPLALKTIGSLLYTKTSLTEWESILTSEIWDLPEEHCNIIPALILSYHHLPPHLKRCFAYCSLFPKDYLFVKEDLILLWMAENFLPWPQQGKTMIVVGEQYFNDLLSRSFFQQSRQDEMLFVMHDLLNDLAKYVGGDFCCRLDVEDAHNIPKMTRHFSFASEILNQPFKGFQGLYDANRLSTFLPITHGSYPNMPDTLMHALFSKLKFLRVLSFYGFNLVELPDTVGNLKHLRCLDLSCTRIRKLPDSVCWLYNLQVLKLKFCKFLKELPLNLHKLINLCYLDFRGTDVKKMPKQFGKLKNLQVLDLFYVGEGSKCNIEELGELNNLHGTLQIMKLQNVVNPLDALAANMKTKKHLVKLMLEWGEKHDDSEKEKEVLEKLQPSKHLKELSIWKYGGKQFPDWFGDNSLLSNVVSLELSDCKYCTLLPTLGLLPSLKKLWINGFPRIQMIGREFYGNGTSSFTTIPFPSLKSLTFSSMKGWEEWECQVVKGAFPRLQELCIYSCPKLKALPPLGLLPSLNKLKISGLHGIKVIGREFYENETSSSSTISFPFLKTLTFYDMEGWEEWECHTVTGAFPCLQELSITNCTKLKGELPEQLPCLMELEISNCLELVASIPWAGGRCMEGSSLKALKITDGPTINIPLSQCYNFLETLHISGGSCDSLRTFPLDIFPMLHQLHLEKCSNLEMISQEHSQTSSLRKLRIEKCPKFISFPRGGLSSPRLESFHIIKLVNLKTLPKCMHILLPSLNTLYIEDCPQVQSFSDGGLPSNLKELYLVNCSKLLIASLKWALASNTSLFILSITGVDVESFPDEGLLPLSLTCLCISNCPNLKKLDYKGLLHLSSLTYLSIQDCPSLQCLPEEGLPKSISSLAITGYCLLLKQRCQKPNGEDWGKISHIDHVNVHIH